MVKGVLLVSSAILIMSSGLTSAAEKKIDTQTPKAETSELRCWQQGKLIFSEVNWNSFTVANKENVINFTKEESESQSLSLIIKGETTCLYQKKDAHFK